LKSEIAMRVMDNWRLFLPDMPESLGESISHRCDISTLSIA